MDPAVEHVPGPFLAKATPLLEEERDAGRIQDLMVSILAPRVAELETEAFQRRLEGRSQPRRRGRERQVAGTKGDA